jgi:hypothetical protein
VNVRRHFRGNPNAPIPAIDQDDLLSSRLDGARMSPA